MPLQCVYTARPENVTSVHIASPHIQYSKGMTLTAISDFKYTILPKVLGHPVLMKGLTTLVISMSTNINV